jgi:hypothetical protein
MRVLAGEILHVHDSATRLAVELAEIKNEVKSAVAGAADRVERSLIIHVAQTLHYVTDRVMAILHVCIVMVIIPLIVGVIFMALHMPYSWPDNAYIFTGIWLGLGAVVTCCFCFLYGVNDYFAVPPPDDSEEGENVLRPDGAPESQPLLDGEERAGDVPSETPSGLRSVV